MCLDRLGGCAFQRVDQIILNNVFNIKSGTSPYSYDRTMRTMICTTILKVKLDIRILKLLKKKTHFLILIIYIY